MKGAARLPVVLAAAVYLQTSGGRGVIDYDEGRYSQVALHSRAIETGEEAVHRCPDRAEPHFWLGASYNRFAEAKGGLSAARLVGRIRREMEASVRLPPAYGGGDAFLALGRLELSVPGLFGGSRKRGVAWLEDRLRVAPGTLRPAVALLRELDERGSCLCGR